MEAKHYLQDGANYQSRAVLACLQNLLVDGEFTIYIDRWQNCREQGYVVYVRAYSNELRQLNIAFFEHRNSDDICAVKWEQSTMNAPTIDTANFGNVYKDKWDVSKTVGCCEFMKMAKWINTQLEQFLEEVKNNKNQHEKV